MDRSIHTPSELGQIIQEARKRQGLTQEDLAGMTSIGRRFISELENGKETAQIGKVLLVLNTLGVSVRAITKWR
jgi:HTH-type transcriptional regulator / antitoxin HipB